MNFAVKKFTLGFGSHKYIDVFDTAKSGNDLKKSPEAGTTCFVSHY
jgi:hypothetical protein